MTRIRYLAFLCADPAALAEFYQRNFGLDEIGRSADGDVTLTDGGFNVTLFRHRPALREPRMELGLHHIGIAVDDVAAVVARYRERYPRGTVIAESGDLQHGQARIYDPECNPVTLSQTNFGLDGGAASRKRPGYRNKHVGDGHSNVAIQAFYSGEEGHEARFGIAHFGVLVPDSKRMAEQVQASGATVKARPAHRTQSEIRMRDPEGNGCDLSQRGW